MLIRGVIRWSNLYGPVTIFTSPGHTEQEFPKIQTPERAGIISRLSTPGVLKARKNWGIPVITIEPSVEPLKVQKEKLEISEILSNSPKIAQWGVEHFLAREFHHFAFCGLPLRCWSDIREKEFERIITSMGLKCFVYPFPDPPCLLSRKEEYPFLAAWLNSLPKPVAVMTCNDDRGSQIVEICNQIGCHVPEQVAVLGVDNDDLICELSQPPLSSIALDLEKTGFHTAELLWNLISQQTSGYHCIPLEPTKIVTRLSSDITEQNDELIRQAIRFIRENYQSPIGSINVARKLDVSRRTLERRFATVLNRSIHEQIQRCRLDQAKALLIYTNDSIEQIAELTGFGNIKPMLRAFIQLEKMTPSQFRKLNQIQQQYKYTPHP
jgi:LacI family transcriptional regulator